MIEIICTRVGMATYRYVRPLIKDPSPEVWADAEIDMRAATRNPGKIWWLAVEGDRVLAQCAAWPADMIRPLWECGHNYEYGHRGRAERYWPKVFAARQAWLVEHGLTHRLTAVTYVFDQPLALHLSAGWTLTGMQDVSEHGHHWQELTWRSR